MKTRDITGSGLDLISLKNKEEYRKFWRKIKNEFRKDLREKKYHPINRKKDEETERGAENFALAAVALSRVFGSARRIMKAFAESDLAKMLKSTPENTKSDLLTNDFNYAQYENRISEQAHKALHDFANVALGDQAEEFNLKRKWVQFANDKDFIGPLPEAFEEYRNLKNKDVLVKEFDAHSKQLATHDIGYHLDDDQLVFSEALVTEKEKMYPLCDGEKGCTVNVFKLKAEPAPQQKIMTLKWDTPQPDGDLAPIYAHK